MAAHRSAPSIESFGVLASAHPALAGDIQVLTEFVNAGHTIVDPTSDIADEIMADAAGFGETRAPAGQVLVAQIGRRTRVSERVVAGGKSDRIPCANSTAGLVIVERLRPLGDWVTGLSLSETIKWTLGSVAADVLRFGDNGLEKTGTVLHLGQEALRNRLVVANLSDLSKVLNGNTHPLSKRATDNREFAYAA